MGLEQRGVLTFDLKLNFIRLCVPLEVGGDTGVAARPLPGHALEHQAGPGDYDPTGSVRTDQHILETKKRARNLNYQLYEKP